MTGSAPALKAPLERIPREIAALSDYEGLARERLDDNAWAYLSGAAGDGITQGWNREAFDALTLCPRPITAERAGSTRVSLLGLDLPHPVLLAPVAYQRLFHPEGERATAMAAAAVDAVMVVATQSSVALEEVAAAGRGGGKQWFQLYMQPDRGLTRALVERAEAAGHRAIVLTVDAPLSGVRNGEQRVGFRLPAGVEAANLVGMNQGPPPASDRDPVFGLGLPRVVTQDDLAWLVSTTRLPVVVKGILHPDTACQAMEAGAAAIIVSNHGGRVLDTALASIDALPRIAEAVDGSMPILLDGGIRRGTDILKALALGARAVLVGRPYATALAAAGPLGVAHAIKLLVEELAVAMILCGCPGLDRMPSEFVGPGRPREDVRSSASTGDFARR